jgi:erythromycin esterase-like protein
MARNQPNPRRRRLRLLVGAAGVLAALGGSLIVAPAAPADPGTQPVTRWVSRHAVPLRTVDPDAPLDDLAPLQRSIGGASIVGLGESIHGAAQETALKARTLRLLVERMGFRSLAWEEDWTTGLLLNDYIQGRTGDLGAILPRMTGQWQSRQTADLLRWLRQYNAGHAGKVRFVGVEYYYTGPEAYDAVDAYVARVAPGRLAELRRHRDAIRPDTETMQQWVDHYIAVTDKQPLIQHAHEVYRLVAGIAHPAGDRAHALALHNARQIVSFYEHYDLPQNDQNVYRDAHAAANLRWWQRLTGDKVAWWAASPHTANAPDLRIALPPGPDFRYPTAGSYLRQWYGHRYLSVGFTFDHGTVGLQPAETVAMPPAKAEWFEHPFAGVGHDQFAVDLREPAPAPVRRWLDAPIVTRGLPQAGPDSTISGGTLAQWFDLIVHTQAVTPLDAATPGAG